MFSGSREVINRVLPGVTRLIGRFADTLTNEMDKLEGVMKEWKQQEKVDMTSADTKNGAYSV